MDRRNITNIVIAIILVVVALLFRQMVSWDGRASADHANATREIAGLRELSTVVIYDIPGSYHTVEFSLFVDADRRIRGVYSYDVTDPDHQVKLDEFSDNLIRMVGGMRLSDLQGVDKVGTSSLTTDAFNKGHAEIKSQL